MAKLTINAEPTFTADVSIPVAGRGLVKMSFTFKHRKKADLQEWLDKRSERTEVETVMDVLKGWGFDDELTPEAVGTLLENHLGSGSAIVSAYIDQLIQGRSGKLKGAARALYEKGQSAAEMADLGLLPEDFANETFEVWPDCWPAVEVFSHTATQWRCGPGGVYGLDYGALDIVMRYLKVPAEVQPDLFADILVMEVAAVEAMQKKG